MTDAAQDSDPWISKWLDAVHTGSATMSQRARSTNDRHGGLEAVIAGAKARGLHLVELTDDKGTLLVAASVHPFATPGDVMFRATVNAPFSVYPAIPVGAMIAVCADDLP